MRDFLKFFEIGDDVVELNNHGHDRRYQQQRRIDRVAFVVPRADAENLEY
eukprot:CAMPEP_0168347968 /NCGR_PEP_ID=MMETSP0213-20121227/19383_1 /TAXON_ID=151035 /ORGANISM="Euplotes harpa, Strain FSP1.4" /LENGTH=49 /DNA_ID=CAMNT_0008357313 /DNA_START=771 /DNA_END=920 /DNA_ORIENTATION=-